MSRLTRHTAKPNQKKSMVNPKYFFQGKLSREEAASAFLATLLEQSPCFFERFMELAQIPCQIGESTIVQTELSDIDIVVFDHESTVVIIEVKVDSGSKTVGQLRRYYLGSLSRYEQRQICCLYVSTSHQSSKSEVESLDLREQDHVASITWNELSNLVASPLGDLDPEFVATGFESVLNMVESRKGTRYPRIGDRDIIYSIVEKALDDVRNEVRADIFGIWKDKSYCQIDTQKCPVTVYVQYRFHADEHGTVRLNRSEGNFVVEMKARIKPAGKYAKQLQDWWADLSSEDDWICAGKHFKLTSDGWMECLHEVSGDGKVLSSAMARLMVDLTKTLEPLAQQCGH